MRAIIRDPEKFEQVISDLIMLAFNTGWSEGYDKEFTDHSQVVDRIFKDYERRNPVINQEN